MFRQHEQEQAMSEMPSMYRNLQNKAQIGFYFFLSYVTD